MNDDAYVQRRYLSERTAPREGMALCLSGGGYRAALFHLGVLRRMNEVGLLTSLDTISAVSSGSILSAHLLDRVRDWPAPGEVIADWEERVARPFRRLTSTNIRTPILMKKLLPWNLLRQDGAASMLADIFREKVTAMTLKELPERPRVVFCATVMQYGASWVFERGCVGSHQSGWCTALPDWPVARAVAASSCFPPIFAPLRLGEPLEYRGGIDDSPDRAAVLKSLSLTDGGVYDNLGLEPVIKSYETIMVSDGGGIFDTEAHWTLVGRLERFAAIIEEQVGSLRRRWFFDKLQPGPSSIKGAYWSISDRTIPKGLLAIPAYSPALTDMLAHVRTDLDAFSPAEIAILENHGYLKAAQRIDLECRPFTPNPDAPIKPPFPEWVGRPESDLFAALKDSRKQTILGRKSYDAAG